MYKILSDIKYVGKILPAGKESDLKKLKKEQIEKLIDNKIIEPIAKAKAEAEAKAGTDKKEAS